MRQLVSTALVALIVASLAGVTVSVLAQEPQSFDPAAVPQVNVDRVDGKHAVGAGATISGRRNKLVATNKNGVLPSNIVNPLWERVRDMPAGFADGVDDGVTEVTVTKVRGPEVTVGPGEVKFVGADCPAGSSVTGGGVWAASFDLQVGASFPWDEDTWGSYLYNDSSDTSWNANAQALCMRTLPGAAVETVSKGHRPAVVRPSR